MIQVKNKKLNKKQLTIIITASVLAFLIIAYAVISTLISSGLIGDNNGGGSSQRPEVLDGESIINGMSAAYPYIAKSSLLSVAVSSHKDAFYMFRDKNDEGAYNSYFEFVYENDDGKPVSYNPAILSKDYNTKYTDFYATESSDGLNATKIDYLCAAIGALYFDERINPEEDRESQLRRYGLSKEDRETILISYINSEGKEDEITIFVGDSLITGVGYYYMIEGRDYIYTSAASERLEYLLSDFESFLHSRIVAAGIPSDGLYEPFLTTDYKQWTNKYYGISNGHEGKYVSDGSNVIIYADAITPVYLSSSSDEDVADGYRHGGYTVHNVDLSYIGGIPHFERLVQVLKGNPIGDYKGKELLVTVNSNTNFAELGSKYKYTILSLESVLADDGEHFEDGYDVGESDLVKIVYDYDVDGVKKNTVPCHGIISLSDAKIPEEVRNVIKNSSVGDSLNLNFEVSYDKDNADEETITKVVTEISIIDKQTETGAIEYPEVIDENCRVTYSYKYLINGSYVLEEGIETVDLSAITEGEDLEIKEKFLGLKTLDGLDILISEEKIYCQYISDFQVYSIQTIKGYVEEDIVVSFEYVNASKRDPFYSESIYKNTLENENKYYPLDATACQNVTFLLGGLGASSNSQVSGGLVGSETVAVGLTPANMDKFNLYDGYTIYFELPRGIVSIPGSADNEVADYKHLSTLGFNLYISRENSDGTRYIGSDMYDIIVKIDGKGFEFLEKTFEEYWSRRNLVMVDISLIDKVMVELGMDDVYGKYDFDLNHKQIYISGNQHFEEQPATGGTEYDFITVKLTSNGKISDSAYSEILNSDLDAEVSLETIYETVTGLKTSVGHDTEATANFKIMLNMLYNISYSGVLSDEEIADAKENAPKIMSITFQLEGEKNNGNRYAYDFYRVSNRRVMVDLYRVDASGNRLENSEDNVSGFYISTFAARKIINGFCSLLNGQTIDQNTGYWK